MAHYCFNEAGADLLRKIIVFPSIPVFPEGRGSFAIGGFSRDNLRYSVMQMDRSYFQFLPIIKELHQCERCPANCYHRRTRQRAAGDYTITALRSIGENGLPML